MPDPSPSTSLAVQIIFLFVLILINAFFALAEMSIVSANKNKIKVLAQDGNKKAVLRKSFSKSLISFYLQFRWRLRLRDFWQVRLRLLLCQMI